MSEGIESVRRLDVQGVREAVEHRAGPLVECTDIHQDFQVRRGSSLRPATVSAVAGVSFEIGRGETLAIVGETGSGKSTLARAIIGAPPPSRGRVVVSGREVIGRRRSAPSGVGRLVQMIFQDPTLALDPQWSVDRLVGEPLGMSGRGGRVARRRQVAEILDRVGLPASRFGDRRPRQLSGGEAQRVAIARALVSSPELVICDEPVTGLDASVQAQILRLLSDLKRDLGLTYLLIAHDLAVVRLLADRTATMYLGKLCEIGPTADIFTRPAHPYTAALLSSIPPGLSRQRRAPAPVRSKIRLLGEPPSPFSPPSGCRFRTRCAHAQEVCARSEPQMRPTGRNQQVACHFPLTGPA